MPKKINPYRFVLSQKKLFLISVIPYSFLVSGGIATILQKQALLDFINIFVWFVCFQFTLFNYAIKWENEYEKNKK